jgi:hypothetical protein
MSYNVNVNGKKVETNSYAAATTVVKAAALAEANRLATRVPAGVYRSPKTTARVNAERFASINQLSNIKFPKAAGDVAGRVGGMSYTITRK